MESAFNSFRAEVSPLIIPVLRAPAGFASLIVPNFPPLFADFGGKLFTLLWRGSRDGFSASNFHGHCDGHANTLTLILDTNGNIFGGFTPAAWESGDWHPKEDPSLRSFVFTLKNPHNVAARKFKLKPEEKDRAIRCSSTCGPHFGDIFVHSNGRFGGTTLFFGTSYTNDTEMDGISLFTGSGNFHVREIEVFEVGAGLEPATKSATPEGAVVDERDFEENDGVVRRISTGGRCMSIQCRTCFKPDTARAIVAHRVAVVLTLRRHPAIIGLVGVAPALVRKPHIAEFFMELMPVSLEDLVRGGADPTVRAKWAVGIALGMRYAHAKRVVHSTLSPRRVLLDGRGEPKIGEFQAPADRCESLDDSIPDPSVFQYFAPEFREGAWGDVDLPFDVYSYGIMLWEIITGIAPFQRTRGLARYLFLEKIRRGLRPDVTALAPWIATFLRRLWEDSLEMRPTFADILDELAAHEYAILPSVDTAAVEEYRNRIEAVEAALR
jgi:hypothetical protein